jgi:hypothetical protein
VALLPGYIAGAQLSGQLGGVNMRALGQDPDVTVTPRPVQSHPLNDETYQRYPKGLGVRVAGSLSTPHAVTSGFGGVLKSMGEYWFERLHIIPKSMAFGNILGTVTKTMELYNAFLSTSPQPHQLHQRRRGGPDDHQPAGPPVRSPAQKGLVLTVQVTTNGVPSFNTTLDFAFRSVHAQAGRQRHAGHHPPVPPGAPVRRESWTS